MDVRNTEELKMGSGREPKIQRKPELFLIPLKIS